MRFIFFNLFWPGLLIATGPVSAASKATAALLVQLQPSAAMSFSAERGRTIWYTEQNERSCVSCHGESVQGPGRHIRTGKFIEPMAPSVNRMRLTRIDKMQKWLRRNCKWTFGRECTAQEQGDVLLWLSEQ